MAFQYITHINGGVIDRREYEAENTMFAELYGRVENVVAASFACGGFGLDSTGNLVLTGTATCWDDLREPLNGENLYSSPGKADYDWTELAVTFDPSGNIATEGDLITQCYQIPHACKTNSVMKLHLHWWQSDSTTRQFTWQYRLQNQGAAKTTSWSASIVVDTNTNNAVDYVTGTINQITDLGDIDTTGLGLSSMVQVKLTRTDAVAGKLYATYLDLHYEIDSFGSNLEYIK